MDTKIETIIPAVHEQSEQPPPSYPLTEAASIDSLSDTVAVTATGRVSVNLNTKLASSLAKLVESSGNHDSTPPEYTESTPWLIPLNIVIQVVGSRGDVQPFVALGVQLQKNGHRIRIATHAVFKKFVQDAGLEFYAIGGDPTQLMAFMVKNPGLIPRMKTFRSGEISEKRRMIAEMLRGCWRSCIEPDPYTGKSFVANAIIANPVSFAHIHCAQALSIPLHMMFTMPWSPTRSFPHPLANISNSSLDQQSANYVSYLIVQALTWQGLADVINGFRTTLNLDKIPTSEAPFLAETLKVPHTYCWSPALIPKPSDWPAHIDVSGFIFRQPPKYDAPVELQRFIQQGPKPIYVGFGSIVVDHPDALLNLVILAIRQSGVRAIISKGWSSMSDQSFDDLDNVYMIEDCPHEWLFQHVAAVVHHGGAGTTAAGLLNGCPTAIVPFFGDQTFWGEQVSARGAGPPPIFHKELTVEKLANAIEFCMTPGARHAATKIAETMRLEAGTAAAADSFHRHLPRPGLECDILPTKPATYQVRLKSKDYIKVSGQAAEILLKNDKIKEKDLTLHHAQRYEIENRRWDPVTSTASSYLGTAVNMTVAANELWHGPMKVHREKVLKSKVDATSKGDIVEPTTPKLTSNDYAKMAGASAMAIPKTFGAMMKGWVVDLPHATTEGLRNTPTLYGEIVAPLPVRDLQSGFVAGGKNFVEGISEGFTGLVMHPYQGAREQGALGFATGLGKGVVGTVSKVGSGALGLWAYPAHGACLSVKHAAMGGTRKKILQARRAYDREMGTHISENQEEAVMSYIARRS